MGVFCKRSFNMADAMEDEERITDLSNPEIVDKYKAAAKVTNQAMAYVASLCQPGASIIEICKAGDTYISTETAKFYSKSKVLRGVGFPTCLSVNNCVANFAPLESDPVVVLQEGDVVKIDLGAHYAADCALHLLRPGNKSTQITEAVGKVAEIFHCQPVLEVTTHKVDRFAVVTDKYVPNRLAEGEKAEEFTFEENEAYVIDVAMSTGEGKPKERDTRTSVYRKTPEVYNLKMKASRVVYSEITSLFGTMPFNLRLLSDEKRARLGIKECISHDLIEEYRVKYEKDGEFVAHFKFTVLLLPNSIQKLNAFNLPYVHSQYNITDPDLQAILAQPLTRKSNAKKKRRKKATTPAADKMDTSTLSGSEDPSWPLSPPSSRCGSPSRSTTSLAPPSCTESASKSLPFLPHFDSSHQCIFYQRRGFCTFYHTCDCSLEVT